LHPAPHGRRAARGVADAHHAQADRAKRRPPCLRAARGSLAIGMKMPFVFDGAIDAPVLEKPNRFSGIRATSGSQWVNYALILRLDHLAGADCGATGANSYQAKTCIKLHIAAAGGGMSHSYNAVFSRRLGVRAASNLSMRRESAN